MKAYRWYCPKCGYVASGNIDPKLAESEKKEHIRFCVPSHAVEATKQSEPITEEVWL